MDLPGAEIVAAGLADLRACRVTAESLALQAMPGRLHALGIEVGGEISDAEIALYEHLRASGHSDAYGYYNSLRRRLDSFCCALEQRQLRPL